MPRQRPSPVVRIVFLKRKIKNDSVLPDRTLCILPANKWVSYMLLILFWSARKQYTRGIGPALFYKTWKERRYGDYRKPRQFREGVMEEGAQQKQVPHVLVFPLPAQGHVNSMLKLAHLLSLSGIKVTFLNSDHNHDRLLRYTDVHQRFGRLPGFRFLSIPDGLPADHPRSADRLMELFEALKLRAKPLFRELVIAAVREREAVSCIIADGILSFASEVAGEVGIPSIAFRTISACSFWSYFCIPEMVQAGEIPFQDDADLDRPIRSVPGMEPFLRRRDLPSFLRAEELTDPALQLVLVETRNTTRASALILNTFDDLEAPILSHIRSHCPKTYTLGPLHALLRSKLNESNPADSPSITTGSSLWKEDRTCMAWLDAHPPKSVLYVSFGSYTLLTRDELVEFWHGLVGSQRPFLWVIRPDLISGDGVLSAVPAELVEGTRERGFLVGWAPQEEVLGHAAVGGFLTHSGWNSTLESIVAGVPMICWPFFADQQVNSRYVGEVWRVGVDMKDTCDRGTVEKMVSEVMDCKREKVQESAARMAEAARRSVGPGGSSYANLQGLVEDIKFMRLSSSR